jgi:hypothetical protein
VAEEHEAGTCDDCVHSVRIGIPSVGAQVASCLEEFLEGNIYLRPVIIRPVILRHDPFVGHPRESIAYHDVIFHFPGTRRAASN